MIGGSWFTLLLRAACVHPGVVASDIWRSVPWCIRCCLLRCMAPLEHGAAPIVQLW